MYCWPPRRLDELMQVKPQYSVPGLAGAQTIHGYPQLLLSSSPHGPLMTRAIAFFPTGFPPGLGEKFSP